MGKWVDKLIRSFDDKNVEAMIIQKPENRRYFSGFTGSNGVLVIGRDRKVLITDFRYTEQASKQAPDFEILEMKSAKMEDLIANVLKEMGAGSVGFEGDYVTVEAYKKLTDACPDTDFLSIGSLPEEIRSVKEEVEIEKIAAAAKIADKAFDYIIQYIKPGMKERDIAVELEYYMTRIGSQGPSFPSIIASGPNSSMPHAIPGDREIQMGDVITMDFGCRVEDYCSDMTRTIAVGSISHELRKIYQTVLDAQLLALEGLVPGKKGADIDRIARDYIRDQGYGDHFGHGLGHGVGRVIHELPVLSPKGEQVLESGMIVTIEPGIYVPGIGGVRIEDLCVMTDSGYRNLTASPKELIFI